MRSCISTAGNASAVIDGAAGRSRAGARDANANNAEPDHALEMPPPVGHSQASTVQEITHPQADEVLHQYLCHEVASVALLLAGADRPEVGERGQFAVNWHDGKQQRLTFS